MKPYNIGEKIRNGGCHSKISFSSTQNFITDTESSK